MPKEIVLDHLPAGYAKHGGRLNQEIDIVFREFSSTEDGQHFVSRLEGTVTQILEKISTYAGQAAATTSSLLSIIRYDRSATVYWNEFHPIVQVRAKGKVNKGDLVFLDHIMDIERVVLPDGLIPRGRRYLLRVFVWLAQGAVLRLWTPPPWGESPCPGLSFWADAWLLLRSRSIPAHLFDI